jgi:hypothetical protein
MNILRTECASRKGYPAFQQNFPPSSRDLEPFPTRGATAGGSPLCESTFRDDCGAPTGSFAPRCLEPPRHPDATSVLNAFGVTTSVWSFTAYVPAVPAVWWA